MAMTVSPVALRPDGLKSDVEGALRVALVSLTFGAADTYVTGGFTLLPSNFGFPSRIVMVEPSISNIGGYQFSWVPSSSAPGTTGQLFCFSAAGTQLGSGSAALQNDVIFLTAWGY